MPHKRVDDLAELHRLLDDTYLGHVAVVTDQQPVAFPTAVARDGESLLVHGSTGSAWMRTVAAGARAAVTITTMDAVVVARTAFESSFHYRSAVVFGGFVPLDGAEKRRCLDVLVDRILPGRSGEIRQPTSRELAATLILTTPIVEWSLKVSQGWPDDPAEDVAGSAWAGIVPLRRSAGAPVAAPDLRDDIPVPPSVRSLDGE